MGWFNDYGPGAAEAEFGYYMSKYPAHRDPFDGHYVAGTRKCSRCSTFKTKKDFTIEQANKPASVRICKQCAKSAPNPQAIKRKAAVVCDDDAEDDDEEDEAELLLLDVEAILEGPHAWHGYYTIQKASDSEAALRQLTVEKLKMRCEELGLHKTGAKQDLVNRIVETHKCRVQASRLPAPLLEAYTAAKAAEKAEVAARCAEARAEKAMADQAAVAATDAVAHESSAAPSASAGAPSASASASASAGVPDPDDDEGHAEDDSAPRKGVKKMNVSLTLTRKEGGPLGFALDNNHVTAVTAGGAAAAAGTLVGDIVVEVNGKDTGMASFASLLPKNPSLPLKLKVLRYVKDESAKRPKTAEGRAELLASTESARAAEARAAAVQAAAYAAAAQAACDAARAAPEALAAKAQAEAATLAKRAEKEEAARRAREECERVKQQRRAAEEAAKEKAVAEQRAEAERAAARAAERAAERAAAERQERAAERAAAERQAELHRLRVLAEQEWHEAAAAACATGAPLPARPDITAFETPAEVAARRLREDRAAAERVRQRQAEARAAAERAVARASPRPATASADAVRPPAYDVRVGYPRPTPSAYPAPSAHPAPYAYPASYPHPATASRANQMAPPSGRSSKDPCVCTECGKRLKTAAGMLDHRKAVHTK